MKKEFIKPRLRVTVLKSRGLLLASPGIYGSLSDPETIGYGGIDENGDLDPEQKVLDKHFYDSLERAAENLPPFSCNPIDA